MSDQPARVSGIRPGVSVRGLDRDDIPVADWLCVCGHHERARGADAVAVLCTQAAVGHCPHAALPAKEAA